MSDLLERMKEANNIESNIEVRREKFPTLFDYSKDGSVILGFSDKAQEYFKTWGAKMIGSVWKDGRNIPGITSYLRTEFADGYIVNGVRMTDEGFGLDVNLSDLGKVRKFSGFPKSEIADGTVYLESVAIRSSQELVESFVMPETTVGSVLIYKDPLSERTYSDCVNEWFKYALGAAGDGLRQKEDKFVTISFDQGGYVAVGHKKENLGVEAYSVDVPNEVRETVRENVERAKLNGQIQGQSIRVTMGVKR